MKPGTLVRIRPLGGKPTMWERVNRLFEDRVFLVLGCDPEHPEWIVVLNEDGIRVTVGDHRLEVIQ